jgi:hypothetical protein
MTNPVREVRRVNSRCWWRGHTWSVWENGDWWRTKDGRRRAWSWRDNAELALQREVDESVGEMVRLMDNSPDAGEETVRKQQADR